MKGTLEDLETSLARGPVEIRFVKLDGSPRVMLATTNGDHSSPGHRGGMIDRTPGVLTVWDLIKEGWRSVRVERITSWTTQH